MDYRLVLIVVFMVALVLGVGYAAYEWYSGGGGDTPSGGGGGNGGKNKAGLYVIDGRSIGYPFANLADAIECVRETSGVSNESLLALATQKDVENCKSAKMPVIPGYIANGRTITKSKGGAIGPVKAFHGGRHTGGSSEGPADYIFFKVLKTSATTTPIQLVTIIFTGTSGEDGSFTRVEANADGTALSLGNTPLAFYKISNGTDSKGNEPFSLVVASPEPSSLMGNVLYLETTPAPLGKSIVSSQTLQCSAPMDLPSEGKCTTLFVQDKNTLQVHGYDSATQTVSKGFLFADGSFPVNNPVLSAFLSGSPASYFIGPDQSKTDKVFSRVVFSTKSQ